ncbi:MAG: TRAP transporter large permease, partial [Candidatus Latescibacteria bacterium]|nr:TRAP transporter large permease [Candidatus Latescibacterota bacterium]
IPFFIFTGIVLGHTSISRRLIDLADCLVGNIPGGLGIVGIIAAVFFAGISGSGPADVAALGIVLISAMTKVGYDRDFSAALTAVSGGIGIIVPPSIALIIYGFIAEVSIPKLFIAGIIPGITVAFTLCLVTYIISKKRGYTARKREDLKIGTAFRRAFWGLLAPVIILGGIYGGVFTPTEAAAVAVIYCILVDMVIYRSMSVRELIRAAGEAGVTSSVIMSIVVTASLFAWILNTEGLALKGTSLLVNHISHKAVLLVIINLILIAAGLFLDAISIFYIFLPVLLPVIRAVGVDPIHFGIIMTINLAIGQVTPPVGVNLIAASGVSGVGIRKISKAALPFIIGECIALLLVTFIPEISLFLPGLF